MTLAADSLTALGFTETEALVYCELLGSSPSTGYRLAQAVGKAPANTYQALSALVQKGAALVDESEGKTFRAVPPDELLAALAKAFESRRAAASNALERLARPAEDDRIYQLKSAEQVMQRAQMMIESAKEILLFDLFPGPFDAMRPALERKARERVVVAGLVYADVKVRGRMIVARRDDYVLRNWPGAQVTVVADAREYLTALLSADGATMLHGTWSDGGWLSCMQHNGLACEIQLVSLDGPGKNALSRLSLTRAAPPGLRNLLGSKTSSQTRGDAA
jgi:sugar-specific transcriptional regulator TrmB